ncbi:MAG: hypothetical protein GXY14_02765 [Spirochaetes bacterium]|nr:hypothetical protein [Spirochaetota bacterium]
MNYSRYILLSGILLLTSGAAARYYGSSTAPFLFSSGGLCKITYILLAVKSGRYRPGREIIFLLTGLALLACGIASRNGVILQGYSLPLITSAVLLKMIFAAAFIVKVRRP